MTPPRRRPQPFAAILKCAVSSVFGIGLPLSEGAPAEKAALTLMFALAAIAVLVTAAPVCRGCVGFVFMPVLFAIGAAAVLSLPLWRAMLREGASRSPLRPLAVRPASAPYRDPVSLWRSGLGRGAGSRLSMQERRGHLFWRSRAMRLARRSHGIRLDGRDRG